MKLPLRTGARASCAFAAFLSAFLLFASPAPARPKVVGALAPHHDVAGALIDRLYTQLAELVPSPARVVLIGPDHFGRAWGNLAVTSDDWSTDSGLLRGDGAGALALRGTALLQPSVHRQDHGITEHIPRVRRFFGDVPVLALIVKSRAADLQLLRAERVLARLLKEEGGVVILSMDLSHYKPRAEAEREDARTLDAVTGFHFGALRKIDADCRRGAKLLLALMSDLGLTEARVLERSNSDDFLKPSERTTGHATVLFTAPGGSSPAERQKSNKP